MPAYRSAANCRGLVGGWILNEDPLGIEFPSISAIVRTSSTVYMFEFYPLDLESAADAAKPGYDIEELLTDKRKRDEEARAIGLSMDTLNGLSGQPHPLIDDALRRIRSCLPPA